MANPNQPNPDQGNDKTNRANPDGGAKQQEQQPPRDQKGQQGGVPGPGQQNRDQPRDNNQR